MQGGCITKLERFLAAHLLVIGAVGIGVACLQVRPPALHDRLAQHREIYNKQPAERKARIPTGDWWVSVFVSFKSQQWDNSFRDLLTEPRVFHVVFLWFESFIMSIKKIA